MEFTALHRLLGRQPGPLTDDMLDDAVTNGLTESADLDWKRDLPPLKGVTQSDFPKDIAAMANAGGGVIVYGIDEKQKAATGRLDVTLDEGHERALRSAAITAVSPPIFGLGVHRLGEDGRRVVVVTVPDSLDGPHLIYRNEYFGAPIRNDADTVWMKERDVAAAYRARFDEQRHSHVALDSLYAQAADGRDTRAHAWFVGVARPRNPRPLVSRMEREASHRVFKSAKKEALQLISNASHGVHAIESVEDLNPRPGLRSWIAPNSAQGERSAWREAWASIHDDGSVTLASAIGGHRISSGDYNSANTVQVPTLECYVADLLGLVRAASNHCGGGDYDVRFGIQGVPQEHVDFMTDSGWNPYVAAQLPTYHPIEATVRVDVGDDEFRAQVYELVTDAVNQAGVREPEMRRPVTGA